MEDTPGQSERNPIRIAESIFCFVWGQKIAARCAERRRQSSPRRSVATARCMSHAASDWRRSGHCVTSAYGEKRLQKQVMYWQSIPMGF